MDTWGRLWMTLALACNFYFIINITILVEGCGGWACTHMVEYARAWGHMTTWEFGVVFIHDLNSYAQVQRGWDNMCPRW